MRFCILLLVAVAMPVVSVRGQEAWVLRGVVSDPRGQPVVGATIDIGSSSPRQTDVAGAFRLDVTADSVRFTVRATGFEAQSVTARRRSPDAEPLRIQLVLSRATRLDSVAVVERGEVSAIPEFEERRKEGFGTFITRRQLDSLGSGASVSEVLRRRASRLQYIRHCLGGVALASTMANITLTNPMRTPEHKGCKMPPACYMTLYIDGVLAYTPALNGLPPQIDQYRAGALEGIEVYRGGSQIPLRYGGSSSACGTVILWTRRTT